MSESYFPHYTEKVQAHDITIAPDERLPMGQTVLMGVQHVVARFGATILAPLLMGFDPNVAILMSGIGTLLFYVMTRGRVPSYLGSSFAFIGGVIAVSGYAGSGPNANIGMALGGIIACGLVYTLVGFIVQAVGTGLLTGEGDLLLEAGNTDLEELVQVAGENQQEFQPFQQGVGLIQRLLEHADVELQL